MIVTIANVVMFGFLFSIWKRNTLVNLVMKIACFTLFVLNLAAVWPQLVSLVS